MRHTDLIMADNVVCLDKAYMVRYSMRSRYRLENRYGTATSAFEKLGQAEDIGQYLGDLAYILSAMIKCSAADIKKMLPQADIKAVTETILRTAIEHSADPEKGRAEKKSQEETDWDFFLFFARFRLRMSEAEFWNSTPRKFFKMMRLYVDFTANKPPRKTKEEIIRRLDAAGL